MSTTLIQKNLWKKLQSKKYRHSFVSSQIGANVSAQIASTRVARGWTQKELAKRAKMSQVRISVLEDPSYENFSIKTLRRIAEAFDTALILKFAPYSEMLEWLTMLRPEHLAITKFEDDSLKIESDKPMRLHMGESRELGQRTWQEFHVAGVSNNSQFQPVPMNEALRVGAHSVADLASIRALVQPELSAASQMARDQDRPPSAMGQATLQRAGVEL